MFPITRSLGHVLRLFLGLVTFPITDLSTSLINLVTSKSPECISFNGRNSVNHSSQELIWQLIYNTWSVLLPYCRPYLVLLWYSSNLMSPSSYSNLIHLVLLPTSKFLPQPVVFRSEVRTGSCVHVRVQTAEACKTFFTVSTGARSKHLILQQIRPFFEKLQSTHRATHLVGKSGRLGVREDYCQYFAQNENIFQDRMERFMHNVEEKQVKKEYLPQTLWEK